MIAVKQTNINVLTVYYLGLDVLVVRLDTCFLSTIAGRSLLDIVWIYDLCWLYRLSIWHLVNHSFYKLTDINFPTFQTTIAP